MSIFTKLILISCFLSILNLVESKTLRSRQAVKIDEKVKEAVIDLNSNRISGFKIKQGLDYDIELVETYSTEQDIYEIVLNEEQKQSSIYVFYVSYETDEIPPRTFSKRILLCFLPPKDKLANKMKSAKACVDFRNSFNTLKIEIDRIDHSTRSEIISEIKNRK
ncbi:hypothetical protein TTHERM_00361750 (macronuclear) [Tetrahymena thermophila SB210]|uniref:ADF-H domain-containing protein n=1 Tax=Tetrahymena thermophila (strain SB210) TaxID=312017 RepID=Q22PG9_TETTS|nr:hypothetical protein TTHERM_00361750 [Tetrahymena thermophila SB210]EAR87140.1 hypothetical protein TTHERM_00361750 [Tetrahymena thermophila SB210]|eukprot:XP_001007385.1 hypothetical protein TTHERM_00361750 [Tetrahymena thermophila SB210]